MKTLTERVMADGYILAVQPSLDDAYGFQNRGCKFKYPLLGNYGEFTCKFDIAKKYNSLEELNEDFMNLKMFSIPLKYEIVINEVDIKDLKNIVDAHKIKRALAKLTEEEKELLGLT